VIYICIPVYNEERTIGVVLWKIRQVMSELGRDYQVLVVDDGSTDGTGDVMAPYARVMPVHVRRNERREGYAASLEALIRGAIQRSSYPKRDVVVTLQGDFTDEPDDVAHLVKRIEGGADVVTARIRPVAGDMPRAMRWSRRLWAFLFRRMKGGDVEGDMLSGVRAYRILTLVKAVEDAGGEALLTTDGWAANAELLRRVLPHSRRSEAVDVQVRYGRLQRESRFRPVRTSLDLARLLRRRGGTGTGDAPPPPADAAGETGLTGGNGSPRRRGRAPTPS
jgi:glycosyltransferase involved in cell wall biosynthesis